MISNGCEPEAIGDLKVTGGLQDDRPGGPAG